jgi:ribosomal protein S18 acetylase RimI-like enzyme
MQQATPITIRLYDEADWAAICRVHDRARPDELRGSCDPRAFVPLAKDRESIEDVRRSRKWLACAVEQVVGFVGVDGTYLSWLYVDPEFYGQGIGRRLLRFGMDVMGPDAWTIALAGNTPALSLYQSEGFTVVRTFAGENAGYPCTCVRLALHPADDS